MVTYSFHTFKSCYNRNGLALTLFRSGGGGEGGTGILRAAILDVNNVFNITGKANATKLGDFF